MTCFLSLPPSCCNCLCDSPCNKSRMRLRRLRPLLPPIDHSRHPEVRQVHQRHLVRKLIERVEYLRHVMHDEDFGRVVHVPPGLSVDHEISFVEQHLCARLVSPNIGNDVHVKKGQGAPNGKRTHLTNHPPLLCSLLGREQARLGYSFSTPAP